MMTTDEIALKRRTACLSVLSNTLLVIGKLSIGLLTGTVSLISEAIHSVSSQLSLRRAKFSTSCLAVRGISCLPPDQDHDYGHGKVENVSAAFESLLIIVAALSILYEAAGKFFHPQIPESLDWAIVIMLASSLINAVVSARLYYVGEKTGSEALKADGMHLRADVWTSAAVMAGIFLMKITGWAILDPLIACLVALGILRVGYKMCRRSYDDLTDASLSDAEESKIGHIIMETPGVKGYHHLRTRISGSETIMDFHLELDRTLPLSQAHAISDKVESALQKKYGPCDPMIHLDPR